MAVLIGFGCPSCHILGWPEWEACPECGRATDRAFIHNVSTAGVRQARRAVQTEQYIYVLHADGSHAYKPE